MTAQDTSRDPQDVSPQHLTQADSPGPAAAEPFSPQAEVVSYSPSRPDIVYDCDFDQFLAYDFAATDEPTASATANTVAATLQDPIADFFASKDFHDWWTSELASGNLDFANCSGAVTAPINSLEAPAQLQPTFAPFLHYENATAGSLLAPVTDVAAAELSTSIADLLALLAGQGCQPQASPSPKACRMEDIKARNTHSPDGFDGQGARLPAMPYPYTNNRLDNDISTIAALDDGYSSDEAPLAVVAESTVAEGDDTVDLTDIIRYYWKGGEFRYYIRTSDGNILISAEDMDERFYGARVALWTFWRLRKRGRVNQARIRAHLRYRGVGGVFGRMFWHLLTKKEQDTLHHADKKGILHKVKL
ncbi:hypothetical protein QFC21_007324 [Naganishia friedmannii]|uniref:Uncharacterized protein n=1 Tax=Naganishia friedmannii TaxID=89922 RepID=A0ACC2UVI8_9TREE|nr:hypothetical protein QFC21_007324 [Naganishia friedmannii]